MKIFSADAGRWLAVTCFMTVLHRCGLAMTCFMTVLHRCGLAVTCFMTVLHRCALDTVKQLVIHGFGSVFFKDRRVANALV